MTRWPAHLLNELHREWLMKKRYWFESVLGLGFIVTVFAGLLLAVVKVGGQPLEAGGADGLIVGFAVWLFALSASGSACQDVQEETSQRTLEQLCIAPLPLAGLLALRMALSLGFAVLMLLPHRRPTSRALGLDPGGLRSRCAGPRGRGLCARGSLPAGQEGRDAAGDHAAGGDCAGGAAGLPGERTCCMAYRALEQRARRLGVLGHF